MVFKKWRIADGSDTTQEYTKVEIDIEVIDLDDFAALELCSNLSTVVLHLPNLNSSLEHSKKVIDSLADLLNTKHNIKSLEIPYGGIRSQCAQARAYLLEILASCQTGQNLESLSITPASSIGKDDAPAVLGSYLRRNRNLKRLHLRLTKCAPDLQLISMLPTTAVTHIRLEAFEEISWFPDLCRRLGQCSSIASLDIFHIQYPDAAHIDALASLVIQCPALQHFALVLLYAGRLDPWLRLGLALSSTKTLSLEIEEKPLLQVLPHLHSCESLEIPLFGDSVRSMDSSIARLPNLKTITVTGGGNLQLQLREDALLDIVKASNSITKATLTAYSNRETVSPTFQAKVDSFCIINKVFGTNLIGFGASELWTRILSKIQDDSARSNFLYRLLREKPELIVCGSQSKGLEVEGCRLL